jgi:hypothetical protein
MPPAGANYVKIRVADPGRLDPDPRLPRARVVDVELLDREPPDLGQDDAAIHDLSMPEVLDEPLDPPSKATGRF